MLNAKECSENAMKCMKLAAEATDPILKQRLSETAQGWNRLAIDLAKLDEKLDRSCPPLRASRLTNEVPQLAKRPQNHRADWTRQEVKALRQLAKENTPTRVIGLKLGRTPASIHDKATREGISLKPTNQSPYGRRS